MKNFKYGQIELKIDKHVAETLIINLLEFSSLNILAELVFNRNKKSQNSHPRTTTLSMLKASQLGQPTKVWN